MTPDVVRRLAALSPVDASADPDLDRALATLGTDLDAETVTDAAVGAGLVVVALGLPVVVLVGAPLRSTALATVTACAAVVAYATYRAPRWLAAARRRRALGEGPDLVARAALHLRLAPTPEGAAAFAARADDPLAASLAAHVRRARGTPRTAWDGFAAEWRDHDPAIGRAVALLRAAVDAPTADRERLLDRALGVALDGTRDRVAAFAEAVRAPAAAVYAFGVLLPLALVGVLPAARAAGVPVSVAAIAAIYDVALPLVLTAASAWLVARRPAAFPPVGVPADHPAVPERRWPALAVGCAAAVVTWVGVRALGPTWCAVPSAVACGVGAALVARYRPEAGVRERVRAVERGLPDALALLGHRLQEGDSSETAVVSVAEDHGGAAGDAFADAARVQRALRVGVREAFLGEYGALRTVPSPRVRVTAELAALAAREGPAGGRVLVEVADHLEELLGVERRARRNLAQVTGTLRHTGLLFAPLVGGATVALADRLGGGLSTGARPVSTPALGAAVGVYVLLLAAVLAALAVALERGADRALVGAHVGTALASAAVVYPTSVVAAGLLV